MIDNADKKEWLFIVPNELNGKSGPAFMVRGPKLTTPPLYLPAVYSG